MAVLSCTPHDIAQDSSCFTCQGEKELLGMAVYLLAQQLVAVDPMADITPKALAAASACFTGCMSGKGLLGAIVYLLCQGSGGGFPPIPGSDVLWIYWESAHVDDNPPADPTKSVMRRFFNGDVPVIWNPTLAAWL